MKYLKKLIVIALLLAANVGHAQNEDSNKKSLHHVLLLQWSDNHDVDSKAEVLSLFKGLPNKVDGLESFEIYKATKSSGKFDNVLIFQFSSEAALKEYDSHPDHLRVKEIAPPLISGYAEYDYWK